MNVVFMTSRLDYPGNSQMKAQTMNPLLAKEPCSNALHIKDKPQNADGGNLTVGVVSPATNRKSPQKSAFLSTSAPCRIVQSPEVIPALDPSNAAARLSDKSHCHHPDRNAASVIVSTDVGNIYGYPDEYSQCVTFSPTHSYSSSTSADTDKMESYDPSAYKLQSPTVSDLSTINTSSRVSVSSPPLPPRVYKPCVVCSDKSSGYHYTVSSCEGCKGFFRRSIQKNMQYTCHKDNHCEINKVTRNRCQSCRLRKCLSMGMSKEAVRNDRKKKKQKSQENLNCSTSQRIEEITERDRRIIETILSAHRDTYPDNDADCKVADDNSKLNTCLLSNIIKMEMQLTDCDTQHNVHQVTDMILWGQVSELSELGIERLAKFAKRVPGFLLLSASDRITLLKASALEILILRLCLRYDLKRDVISFACGMSLDRIQIKAGGFGSLTEAIFKLAASFKQLCVDETIMSLLTAICLISGDRWGLENTLDVETTQEPILIALDHYISTHYSSEPRLLAKLLLKLTDLRKISIEGAEDVLKLCANSQTNISPLLAELLVRSENVDLTNPVRASANMVLPPEINKTHTHRTT